jgi:hypothetical protein
MACSALVFSVPSYHSRTYVLTFLSLPPSFDRAYVRKCFRWWCGTPHVTGYMTVRVGCSHLYRVGPQSLLNRVFPILESKYAATCKKVSVTLRMKLNVHFEMTAIQTVLTQSDETKKLTHCKFLLKQFDHFFVYCIRT